MADTVIFRRLTIFQAGFVADTVVFRQMAKFQAGFVADTVIFRRLATFRAVFVADTVIFRLPATFQAGFVADLERKIGAGGPESKLPIDRGASGCDQGRIGTREMTAAKERATGERRRMGGLQHNVT